MANQDKQPNVPTLGAGDVHRMASRQGHVVHGSSGCIVCVSARATPLHMSAAADEMALEGLCSASNEQPHSEGQSQPVTTALLAIHKVAACSCARSGGQGLQEVKAGLGTEDLTGVGIPCREIPVPEAKATLLKAVNIREGSEQNKPQVLIIIMGGTICMDYAYKNTCLRPSRLGRRLTQCVELTDESLPHFDILEWDCLVDSSDLGKDQYSALAKQIEAYYQTYDGFVVLHGTDTMAYTASMLSFMLENLGKPVVFTGSTLPMMHISSDAKRNVGLSLMVAGYSELTEVVVVFGSQVLRGTRVTKSNCASMEAFSSPNFPAIGSIGVDVVIHDRLRAPLPSGEFKVFTDLECNVCTIKLTPGMPVEVLESVFSTKKRPFAVVLELFGAGTAPNNDRFLSAIKNAIDSGIIVVATTQCERGATNLLIYENGVWISSLGVICARDMTNEAITAKLYYLMGKGATGRLLKELMESNIRGEVTVAVNKVKGDKSEDGLSHTEIARKIARDIAERNGATATAAITAAAATAKG